MKIKLDEIPKDGLFLEQTSTGDLLELERDDIKFSKPVVIKATVGCERDHVQICVEIESMIKFMCARCLREGEQLLNKKIKIVKLIKEEKVIDLTQLAREEIMLDYPEKFLCREDCKGLCSSCGVNLNDEYCNCKQESLSFGDTQFNI